MKQDSKRRQLEAQPSVPDPRRHLLSAFLDDLTKRNAPGFDYSAFERGARYFNTRQSSSRQLRSQVYTGSVGCRKLCLFRRAPGRFRAELAPLLI
jgi:hypothetical protein